MRFHIKVYGVIVFSTNNELIADAYYNTYSDLLKRQGKKAIIEKVLN